MNGGTALVTDSFTFLVADVDRTSTIEDFSTTFGITMTSNEIEAPQKPQGITFDLDLDAFGRRRSNDLLREL